LLRNVRRYFTYGQVKALAGLQQLSLLIAKATGIPEITFLPVGTFSGRSGKVKESFALFQLLRNVTASRAARVAGT
jgi:hypothetical protein